MYHSAVTRLKLWVYKALYDMNKYILIIFRKEVVWNYTKNFSNFIQFLLFYGPLLNTGQPQNQWATEQSRFLRYHYYGQATSANLSGQGGGGGVLPPLLKS